MFALAEVHEYRLEAEAKLAQCHVHFPEDGAGIRPCRQMHRVHAPSIRTDLGVEQGEVLPVRHTSDDFERADGEWW